MAVCEDLHEQDAKRPDVRFYGEFSERNCFWSRPFHGKSCSLVCWIFVVNNHSCQSKIRNFGDQVLADEHVSCRQISVNQALPLKMSHAIGNLNHQKCKQKFVYVSIKTLPVLKLRSGCPRWLCLCHPPFSGNPGGRRYTCIRWLCRKAPN